MIGVMDCMQPVDLICLINQVNTYIGTNPMLGGSNGTLCGAEVQMLEVAVSSLVRWSKQFAVEDAVTFRLLLARAAGIIAIITV